MKIRDIRAIGLRGVSPEGGWSAEIRPDDCVHTLVAVLTDEGDGPALARRGSLRRYPRHALGQ